MAGLAKHGKVRFPKMGRSRLMADLAEVCKGINRAKGMIALYEEDYSQDVIFQNFTDHEWELREWRGCLAYYKRQYQKLQAMIKKLPPRKHANTVVKHHS